MLTDLLESNKVFGLCPMCIQLNNMYSYLNSSLKLSDIVRGLSCQISHCNLLLRRQTTRVSNVGGASKMNVCFSGF